MDLPEFLRTSPAFEEFTQSDISVLERALRVDRFPANHVLLRGPKPESIGAESSRDRAK